MSIGRLIVEFEARTGKFETDTGRAAKLMEKRAREMEKAAMMVGARIGKAFAAIAGPAGLGLLIKNALDAADEMSKLAQKVGVSTEALSQLQHAANLSGVEDLGGALAKFNRTAGEAAQGTKEQAAAFKTLGVEIRNTDGTLKNTETLFTETAEAISKMPDGIKKTQVAMDLFGKSGAQLIPLLNLGREGLDELRKEADALGLTLDERTGRAAEGFNDNLTRLGSAASGIGTRLAAEFAPELERLTGLLVDTAKDTNAVSVAAEGLSTVFKGLILAGVAVGNTFQAVGKSFAGLAAAFASAATGNFRGAQQALEAAGDAVRQDFEDVKKAYERLFGDQPELAPRRKIQLGGDVIVDEEASKARQKTADEIQRIIDRLKEQNETFGQTAAQSEIYALAQLGASKAQIEYASSLAASIDAKTKGAEVDKYLQGLRDEAATYEQTNEFIEQYKLQQMGATQAQIEEAAAIGKTIDRQKKLTELRKEADQILKKARTPAEEYQAQIAKINELLGEGIINQEQYNSAVLEAQDAFDKAIKAADPWAKQLESITDQAARNIQDAFADFLFNPFENGIKGMVRSFAQAMQRMAAEALAAGIFQKLAGSVGGGGGGGLFGSLFSLGASVFGGGFSSSGTYTAANVPGRALGGPVAAGVPYLVGERGPELMVPSTAGKIVPNNALGGGQQNIRIVNAFDASIVGDYLMSSDGEKVIDNYVRRNGAKIRNQLANG